MTTTHDDLHRSERMEYTRWLADPRNAAAEGREHIQTLLDRLPAPPGAAAAAAAPAADLVAVDSIAESWDRAFATAQANSAPRAEPAARHAAAQVLGQPQPAASAEDPHGWDLAFARAASDRS
jgi:hypothetical protein